MPGSVPPAPGFIEIIVKVLYYLSLSVPVGIGTTVAALAIPEVRGGVVARRVRGLALPAAIFVGAVAVVQFLDSGPQTGVAPLQPAAFALVVVGLVAMRARPSRWLAYGVVGASVATAVIPQLPASTPTLSGLARNALTVVHVLGALFWIGGLVVLAVVGMLGHRTRATAADQADTARDWGQIWNRFSVIALFSVGALVVSGVFLAWTHVGAPSQLFTTAYGRYLAVKLVLVVALLAAGAYNTRVLMPEIQEARRDGDTGAVFSLAARRFPAMVAGEALVVIAILFVVPFLRGSARTEAGWPAARPFDLEVFGTGLVLVALTAAALWLGTRAPSHVPSGGREESEIQPAAR